MDSKQSIQIVDVAAAKICTILDRESNVKLQEEHITAEDFTRALNHFKNMNKDEKTNLISTEQLKLLDSVLQQKHRDELKAKIKTKFEEELETIELNQQKIEQLKNEIIQISGIKPEVVNVFFQEIMHSENKQDNISLYKSLAEILSETIIHRNNITNNE